MESMFGKARAIVLRLAHVAAVHKEGICTFWLAINRNISCVGGEAAIERTVRCGRAAGPWCNASLQAEKIQVAANR